MKIKPRTLLLWDGLGALVSAFLLGFVLVKWESFFGMPPPVLFYLAGLALIFAIYSLTAYFLNPQPLKKYLKIIALINLLYCLLTLIILFINFSKLSTWGLLYFFLEILIILGLVYLEWKARVTP